MQAGEAWPPPPSDDLDEIREASRQFTRANEGNPDPCSTMAVQTAALLALRARQVTGQGQQVFVSMLSANQYANSDDALSYAGKPPRPTLDRWVYGTGPLRRLYRASEGWLMLSAERDEDFTRLRNALGRPDLAALEGDSLAAALEGIFASRTADQWERELIAAEVGAVRADSDANSGQFWLRDEQVRANNLAPRTKHVVLGEYQRWGPVVAFEKNPGTYGGGTIAGEHTNAILGELGLSEEQIRDLQERKVVWTDQSALDLAASLNGGR